MDDFSSRIMERQVQSEAKLQDAHRRIDRVEKILRETSEKIFQTTEILKETVQTLKMTDERFELKMETKVYQRLTLIEADNDFLKKEIGRLNELQHGVSAVWKIIVFLSLIASIAAAMSQLGFFKS